MKIPITYTIGALLALFAVQARAATATVLPGQSVQTAFNNATAGDMIIIKAGVYNEDLTLNKNLDVRPESGAVVSLTGNLTLNAISGTFPFAKFKLGSANNKTLTITNCPDVFLEDIDGITGGLTLSVTGSKVYAYSSSFKTVTFNSSDWTMQECNTTGTVTSNSSDTRVLRCNIGQNLYHSSAGESNCTVFQSTISEFFHSKAKRSWFGYNTVRQILIDGGGASEAEIVGNTVDRENLSSSGANIQLNGANLVCNVRNNKIIRNYGGYNTNHGVWVTNGSKIRIHNNIFHRLSSDGINIDSVGECEIVGNFFTFLGYYCVRGEFNGVKCNDNWYWSQGQIDGFTYGGVVAQNTGVGDPKFVAYNHDALTTSNNYTLQSSSPLINEGSIDPEFKDHDGTRQDIGLYGGHHFDSNGTTSENPVVLSADLAPIRIQKGVTSIVKIKSRAVVSTKR